MTGNPGDNTYDPDVQGTPVNIIDGAGNLNANIVQLDADIVTLNTDINTLDTDVKANTAAIAGPSTVMYTGTVTAPIAAGTAIIIGTQACKSVILQAPAGKHNNG